MADNAAPIRVGVSRAETLPEGEIARDKAAAAGPRKDPTSKFPCQPPGLTSTTCPLEDALSLATICSNRF